MFWKLNVLACAVGLAGLLGACGVQEEGRGTAQIPRGLGKADSDHSCQGICGGQAPGGCWCDDQCTQYGDCCPDKVQVCDQQQPSCEGHCGDKSPDGCWCDDQCARYGDCCPDKQDKCDAGPATCTKDADCAANEFCAHKEGECLLPTFMILQGTCAWKPEACTMQYDPVCGCDGKTYGNACSAASAGVSVASKGECQDACWGAWVDENGNCRGPADGVLPDSCCTEEKQQLCAAIDKQYAAAVKAAKECVPWPTFAPQCTFLVATSLVGCSATCSTYINGSPTSLSTFSDQWKQLKCDEVPWICAAYICPLPTGGGCTAQDDGGHACVDFHE